jgi:hypothetical protein
VIVSPASFVRNDTKALLSYKSFNHRYGNIGGAEAHKKAIKSKNILRYDGISYTPHRADKVADVVTVKGRKCLNLFVPQKIKPLDGRPERFIYHMAYLIPDPVSRGYFLDWLAWLIQHPELKMMFAVLLLGPKRTGKSWIAKLLKVILGAHNCSEPNSKRVASDFNGWLAYKLLVIIHELREKGARTLADTLKPVITEDTVPINLKNIEPFEIDNFANLLTISNHEDAIPLDDDEGRYLVIRCADQPWGGRGTDKSKVYYQRLFDCIGTADAPGDEARRVLSWLLKRKITLDCRNIAPETEAKADMVESSRSDLEKFLHEAKENGEPPLACAIINPGDVLDFLPPNVPSVLRNRRAVELALRELGAKPLSQFKQIHTASGKKRLWALDGQRLAEFYKMPRAEIAAIYDAGRVQHGVTASKPIDDFTSDPCA